MRPEDDIRPTVSIMKACALVSVSRRTIYNWLEKGMLEHYRTAGGSVRIIKESLWQKRPDKGIPHANI